MSEITINAFAEQIGIEAERLVKQLNDAGVSGKSVDDSLRDDEKRQLLEFLRGGTPAPAAPSSRGKITLKQKTSSEIKQTSKTGIARTVHVQTKKRRTFVKREVLAQQEAEREQVERQNQEIAKQEEQVRLAAEQQAAEVEAERVAQEQAVVFPYYPPYEEGIWVWRVVLC